MYFYKVEEWFIEELFITTPNYWEIVLLICGTSGAASVAREQSSCEQYFCYLQAFHLMTMTVVVVILFIIVVIIIIVFIITVIVFSSRIVAELKVK